MHPKNPDQMTNSVGPDQTAVSVPKLFYFGILAVYNMSRNMTKNNKISVHPAKTEISLGIC